MAISSTTAKNTYNGNGSTTVFAYTFRISDEDNIKVQLKNTTTGVLTLQTKTTNYTVSGVDADAGGNITFLVAPTSTDVVVLTRNTPLLQGTDYVEAGLLPADVLELDLDELTMIAQQINEEVDRTIKVDEAVTGFDATLPTPTADKYLKFDATATGLEAFTLSTGAGLGNVVEDTSPQLGGTLDCNSYNIQFDDATGIFDDSSNEFLTFTKTASAVNNFNILNNSTGLAPLLSVEGGDTNISICFRAKGTGGFCFEGTSTSAAGIRLYEDTDNGGNYMEIKAPAAITSGATLVLPDGDGGANTTLLTNGSGTLSWSTLTGVAATQAEQETGTSTTVPVTPGRQQYHESACKGWCSFSGVGTVSISNSYNVSSLVDNGVGNYTVNWDTDFSHANYATALAGGQTGTLGDMVQNSSVNTGNVTLLATNGTAAADIADISITAFGDQ